MYKLLIKYFSTHNIKQFAKVINLVWELTTCRKNYDKKKYIDTNTNDLIQALREIQNKKEKTSNCCKECPQFYQTSYNRYNEKGIEGRCRLEYTQDDKRNFSGTTLYKNCKLYKGI